MDKPVGIVIHCAATPDGQEFHASDIDRWHKERGWKGIGYHFVIPLDGSLEIGRGLAEDGAHAKGWNTCTIGVCLIGTRRFTPEQWDCLARLVTGLKFLYPGVWVLGHRDLDGVKKECPGFDVSHWMGDDDMVPPPDNLLSKSVARRVAVAEDVVR